MTDKQEICIRMAYPQDAAEIAVMLMALQAHEHTSTGITLDAYTSTIARLITQAPSQYYFTVAEKNERLIGFVSYYFGYDLSTLAKGTHIGDIFVADAMRGQGIGTRLMGYVATKTLSECGYWISLTNVAHNKDAHAFYASLHAFEVPVRFLAWGKTALQQLTQKV